MKEFSLKLVSHGCFSLTQASYHSSYYPWRYVFKKQFSLTSLEILTYYKKPDPSSEEDSPFGFAPNCRLIFKLASWSFRFESYLRHKNSMELADLDKYLHHPDPNVQNLFLPNFLGVVRKYLKGDLKGVMLGLKWINVPFDWEAVGR